jgi:hypothetical protein
LKKKLCFKKKRKNKKEDQNPNRKKKKSKQVIEGKRNKWPVASSEKVPT